MSKVVNLKEALKAIKAEFVDDGGYIVGELQEFLKMYNVSYIGQVAKVLVRSGLIKKERGATGKPGYFYWNADFEVITDSVCENIYDMATKANTTTEGNKDILKENKELKKKIDSMQKMLDRAMSDIEDLLEKAQSNSRIELLNTIVEEKAKIIEERLTLKNKLDGLDTVLNLLGSTT